MVVAESLELALGPGVEDPVLDGDPGGLRLILGLVPGTLHLGNESILVLLGRLLGLDALLLQVGAELVSIPRVVRRDDVGVPVLLDELLEILAVGRSGVGNVMVRKPALKLGLMPLVVRCKIIG